MRTKEQDTAFYEAVRQLILDARGDEQRMAHLRSMFPAPKFKPRPIPIDCPTPPETHYGPNRAYARVYVRDSAGIVRIVTPLSFTKREGFIYLDENMQERWSRVDDIVPDHEVVGWSSL